LRLLELGQRAAVPLLGYLKLVLSRVFRFDQRALGFGRLAQECRCLS
jgi:hypothetical protein